MSKTNTLSRNTFIVTFFNLLIFKNISYIEFKNLYLKLSIKYHLLFLTDKNTSYLPLNSSKNVIFLEIKFISIHKNDYNIFIIENILYVSNQTYLISSIHEIFSKLNYLFHDKNIAEKSIYSAKNFR